MPRRRVRARAAVARSAARRTRTEAEPPAAPRTKVEQRLGSGSTRWLRPAPRRSDGASAPLLAVAAARAARLRVVGRGASRLGQRRPRRDGRRRGDGAVAPGDGERTGRGLNQSRLAGERIAAVAASPHVLALSAIRCAVRVAATRADGVLGIGPLPNLPLDADGHPFQPSPVKVEVERSWKASRDRSGRRRRSPPLGCTASAARAWDFACASRVGLPDDIADVELRRCGGGGGGVVQDGAVAADADPRAAAHSRCHTSPPAARTSSRLAIDVEALRAGRARATVASASATRRGCPPTLRRARVSAREIRIVLARRLRVVGAAAGLSRTGSRACRRQRRPRRRRAVAPFAFGLAIEGGWRRSATRHRPRRQQRRGDGGGGGVALAEHAACGHRRLRGRNSIRRTRSRTRPIPTAVTRWRHARVVRHRRRASHSLAAAADGRAFGWILASHGRLGLGLGRSTSTTMATTAPSLVRSPPARRARRRRAGTRSPAGRGELVAVNRRFHALAGQRRRGVQRRGVRARRPPRAAAGRAADRRRR